MNKEKQKLEPKPVADYTLRGTDGREIRLSELFGGKRELILIHNMGTSCPNCTMWADGFNGLYPHLADRAGFVVTSNDEPAVQKKFAESRGWKFPMVSAKETTLFSDLGFTFGPDQGWGKFAPGVSTFKKGDDGKIYQVGRAGFGPGDDFCATWHLFDLLENGAGEWQAKFKY